VKCERLNRIVVPSSASGGGTISHEDAPGMSLREEGTLAFHEGSSSPHRPLLAEVILTEMMLRHYLRNLSVRFLRVIFKEGPASGGVIQLPTLPDRTGLK